VRRQTPLGFHPMLVCITCGSRFDADARPAATFVTSGCPLCGDALVEFDDPPTDASDPVHADVASVLREHLLGVGA
jgi:predicted  nucleic acid-binding Zn-ribbon protein